jgi:hypothetical protein
VRFILSRALAPVGPPMIQFVSLENGKQKSGAQKGILKLVGEEPTSVTPDEIEKLVRELPRDPEIVELFKAEISDECMIARPGPAILQCAR